MTADERASIAVLTTEVHNIGTTVAALDVKVDTLAAKLDKAEGVLSVVRWLGFGGILAIIGALLYLANVPRPSA